MNAPLHAPLHGLAAASTLAGIGVGQSARVTSVTGERGFRRRLLELGLLPGVQVRLVGVAPLGDPLELELRGGRLSIRRQEASCIGVEIGDGAA